MRLVPVQAGVLYDGRVASTSIIEWLTPTKILINYVGITIQSSLCLKVRT